MGENFSTHLYIKLLDYCHGCLKRSKEAKEKALSMSNSFTNILQCESVFFFFQICGPKMISKECFGMETLVL